MGQAPRFTLGLRSGVVGGGGFGAVWGLVGGPAQIFKKLLDDRLVSGAYREM